MRIGLRPHCLSWPDRVHLVLRHDNSLIAGKAIHLESAADGLYATFWINHGDRGERAFVLAEMGWGLSCRFNLLDYEEVDEVWCTRAEITEISLVPKPAFP